MSIEKIVIHYKSGKKPLVLEKGFVGYFEKEDQDLKIDFLEVDEKDIKPILGGLVHALKAAHGVVL